jgi:hypothetical protein
MAAFFYHFHCLSVSGGNLLMVDGGTSGFLIAHKNVRDVFIRCMAEINLKTVN